MASPLEDALEALSNVHRRRLLLELRDDNPRGEVPLSSLETTHGERLAIEMTHVHLPKLERSGYVEWDRETETVHRGPQFEELDLLLDAVEGGE